MWCVLRVGDCAARSASSPGRPKAESRSSGSEVGAADGLVERLNALAR
jgi:hypothetical protein